MRWKACEVHGRRAAVAPSVFFTASGFFERDRKKDWGVKWECNGKVTKCEEVAVCGIGGSVGSRRFVHAWNRLMAGSADMLSALKCAP